MILITGGTGLVGQFLIKELIKTPNQIRAIYRNEMEMAFITQTKDKVEWVCSDINDIISLENCFSGIKKVYHCAAMISFQPVEKKEMFRINIDGTTNIVNLCLKYHIEKLCHVSSIAAIQTTKNGTSVNESQPWVDGLEDSNYGISKYLSELEVWRGIAEGLNAVIVNPSFILGPGNLKRSSTTLFNYILEGNKYYTTGSTGFVDVRDVVKVMIQLMESNISGERYIVSEGNYTFQYVFGLIAKFFEKPKPSIKINKFISEIAWRVEKIRGLITHQKPLISKETAKNSHLQRLYDNQAIKKALNYQFFSIEETIKWTCNELKKQSV